MVATQTQPQITPEQALDVLHNACEQVACSGKDRDILRTSTYTLSQFIKDKRAEEAAAGQKTTAGDGNSG